MTNILSSIMVVCVTNSSSYFPEFYTNCTLELRDGVTTNKIANCRLVPDQVAMAKYRSSEGCQSNIVIYKFACPTEGVPNK